MKKSITKKYYIVASVVVVVLVSAYFIGESIIASKIENAIKTELSTQLAIDYETLDLNLLKRQVVLKQIKLLPIKKEEEQDDFEVVLKKFSVRGFSIWNFLIKDKISIREIDLLHPQIVYKISSDKEKSNTKASSAQFDKSVTVASFHIEGGVVQIYNQGVQDSLLFETTQLNFILEQLKIDETTLQENIPFVYDDYSLTLSNLFYRLSAYENLRLISFQSTPAEISIEDLSIHTKYSKNELQQHIAVERDHFKIDISQLTIKEQRFGFEEDSAFFFQSSKVHIQSTNMEIYRDKLTADDETHKKLYSKMLRELNIHLSLDEVVLENTAVAYSEKVNEGMDAGTVSFHKLNATIQNLGNTYAPTVKTQIDIDAIFMKQTPIEVHWAFDVHNLDDHFLFKAALGKLPAMDMNPFSEPNLKVKLDGELLKTYFTVDGNYRTSQIDLKMDYTDFNVDILTGDGQRTNKFLSAIADIFIKKDSESSEDAYREISKSDIERDPTKSVFNFLWQNIKAALFGVMTGGGSSK